MLGGLGMSSKEHLQGPVRVHTRLYAFKVDVLIMDKTRHTIRSLVRVLLEMRSGRTRKLGLLVLLANARDFRKTLIASKASS